MRLLVVLFFWCDVCYCLFRSLGVVDLLFYFKNVLQFFFFLLPQWALGTYGQWANCLCSHFAGYHLNLQIIAPAGERRLLTELTIIEGFQANRHGNGRIMLGIDARWELIYWIDHYWYFLWQYMAGLMSGNWTLHGDTTTSWLAHLVSQTLSASATSCNTNLCIWWTGAATSQAREIPWSWGQRTYRRIYCSCCGIRFSFTHGM